MKKNLNFGFVIALTFVIIYLVVKIYKNPKFEFFDSNNTPVAMNPSFSSAVEAKRKEMNQQMLEQYDQDKRINAIKSKIDALRNDLKIIKSKEQEELNSIYEQVKGSDSVAEAMAVDEGNAFRGMVGAAGVGAAGSVGSVGAVGTGKGGKNFNLNFNLDEE